MRIGRRKTWLIPTQYLIGIFMLLLSSHIDTWLGSSEMSPNIGILTVLFFSLNFLAATQDIAVDGWALTMLKKHNIGHASTCNSVGQTAGFFLSYVLFMALESPDFCNRYLRTVPDDQGELTNKAICITCSIFLFINVLGWRESNFGFLVRSKTRFFLYKKWTLISRISFILFDNLLPSSGNFMVLHWIQFLLLNSKKTQSSAIWGHRYYWNFYHLRSFVNFEINVNPMAQGRGCMGDATLLPNLAPIVSYVLLKMCKASHCRGGTQFLHDLPILALSLWLLPPISQVVGSKHLSWSFGCLEAAQNTQHL